MVVKCPKFGRKPPFARSWVAHHHMLYAVWKFSHVLSTAEDLHIQYISWHIFLCSKLCETLSCALGWVEHVSYALG